MRSSMLAHFMTSSCMKQYSFHLFEAGRPEQCFFSPFFASSVRRYLSVIHEIRLRRDAAAAAAAASEKSGAEEATRLEPSLSNSSHSAIKEGERKIMKAFLSQRKTH